MATIRTEGASKRDQTNSGEEAEEPKQARRWRLETRKTAEGRERQGGGKLRGMGGGEEILRKMPSANTHLLSKLNTRPTGVTGGI